MYHKHRYGGDKNQENKKSKPRAGWDEDENDYKIKSTGGSNFSKSSYSNNSYKSENINEPSNNSSTNYRPPDGDAIKKSTISIEQKLIEDLTLPTGISLRPNDNQMKELSKRAKNLDRDLILKFLFEKLNGYQSLTDASGQKVLIKTLYVVEHLLLSGLSDIFLEFYEKREIFENIKEYHSGNKKIVDVINQICHTLEPNNNSNNVNAQVKNANSNFNLLGEGESKQVNLLDDIISNTSTNQNAGAKSNVNIFNIFTNTNTTANLIDEDLFKVSSISNENKNSNLSNANPKAFSFIKKTQNNNQNNIAITNTYRNTNSEKLHDVFSDLSLTSGTNQTTQNAQPQNKKAFNFIKSKDNPNTNSNTHTQTNTQSNSNSPLDLLFNTPVSVNNNNIQNSFPISNNDIPTVDLTKGISANIDEVFSNKRTSVDLKQITNSYSQNFDNTSSGNSNKPYAYEAPNIDLLMNTNFDYNKVNTYIDSGKGKQKDHFSFVEDLLKTKKN